MASFTIPTREFRYNPNAATAGDDDGDGAGFSGILEVYVHHARNLHNICIYDKQDVYAKFSLTYNPDETIATRIVNGGGKNPEFQESLAMGVAHKDAVLKCEIWMLSRARNLLEDQLLGFALVPISLVAVNGNAKVTQDFSLSSTDLFHSPAGTVKLTLSLKPSPNSPPPASIPNSSIASEVVLLHHRTPEEEAPAVDRLEYSRIEFPDMGVVRENQKMVTEYFCSRIGSASFLHLGACPPPPPPTADTDQEMAETSAPPEAESAVSVSPNESSGFWSSTTTSLGDDRNSADSADCADKKPRANANYPIGACPAAPTSSSKGCQEKEAKEGNGNGDVKCDAKLGHVFGAPLVGVNLEAEQSAMQQHIVDMYMKSMQQFTESLGKMKLPMDLNKSSSKPEVGGDLIHNSESKLEAEKKKDGSRVFYGSRAFF